MSVEVCCHGGEVVDGICTWCGADADDRASFDFMHAYYCKDKHCTRCGKAPAAVPAPARVPVPAGDGAKATLISNGSHWPRKATVLLTVTGTRRYRADPDNGQPLVAGALALGRLADAKTVLAAADQPPGDYRDTAAVQPVGTKTVAVTLTTIRERTYTAKDADHLARLMAAAEHCQQLGSPGWMIAKQKDDPTWH